MAKLSKLKTAKNRRGIEIAVYCLAGQLVVFGVSAYTFYTVGDIVFQIKVPLID